MTLLDPNRLFPIEKKTKDIAKNLYRSIENIPIISPHGHTDPHWFSENKPLLLLITMYLECCFLKALI